MSISKLLVAILVLAFALISLWVNRMTHTSGGKDGKSINKSKGSTTPFYHLLILFYFLVIYRLNLKAYMEYSPSLSVGYLYFIVFPLFIFFFAWLINFFVRLFNKHYFHSLILELIFYLWYIIYNTKFISYNPARTYDYEHYLGVTYELYFWGGLILMFVLFRVLDLAFLITRNQKTKMKINF